MANPAVTADPMAATAALAGSAILVGMDAPTAAMEVLVAVSGKGEVTDAPPAAMAVTEDRATDSAPPSADHDRCNRSNQKGVDGCASRHGERGASATTKARPPNIIATANAAGGHSKSPLRSKLH